MRKNIVIWVLVAVIILGGAWFYYSQAVLPAVIPNIPDSTDILTTPTKQPSASVTTHTKSAPTPANTQTYKSLITQEGNHQCDYSRVTSSGQTSGVVYIADGNMRAEMRTSDVVDVRTLVVYDGRYLYTWSEGKTTGTKTQPSSVSQLPLIIPKNLNQGGIIGSGSDSVSWNCHSWLKDSKLLAPPSYVTFK